jgi:hypothetical protein
MVAAGVLAIRISGDRGWRIAAVAVLMGLFMLHLAHRSIDLLDSPNPKQLEARYYDVAKFLDANTPANSFFITEQHSGSIRYYAHRLTMRPTYIKENQVSSVLEWSRDRGYHAYVIVEDWEMPAFKLRFPNWSQELERSLVFGYAGPRQVFVYDPALKDPPFARIPAEPVPLVPRPMLPRDVPAK